jgi:hypothetical protein
VDGRGDLGSVAGLLTAARYWIPTRWNPEVAREKGEGNPALTHFRPGRHIWRWADLRAGRIAAISQGLDQSVASNERREHTHEGVFVLANEPGWSELFCDEDHSRTPERLSMARLRMGG